jgi:hypothetical protein
MILARSQNKLNVCSLYIPFDHILLLQYKDKY